VDVVGVHVVGLDQRRQTLFQALQRQAVGGIDAGCAQDADDDAAAPAPGAQLPFGIDAAPGARIVGGEAPGLVNQGTGTIAVNPCRAYVNQAPW